MISIGLTGGIAAGKSTVGRLLAARGARVVDADRVAHETYAPGTPGFAAVLRAFGSTVLDAGGAIDRAALGRLVFSDPARLQQLTAIVWPLARTRVEARQREAAAAGAGAFVIEAVRLREAGWSGFCDQVWLVRAPVALVRERLRQRGGLTPSEIEARLAAQTTGAASLEGVDVVIDNDAGLESLEPQVEAAWQAALKSAR